MESRPLRSQFGWPSLVQSRILNAMRSVLAIPAWRRPGRSRRRAVRNPSVLPFTSHSPRCQRYRRKIRTSSEGPFGEVIRVSGSQAAQNPFRFSTKFTDEESGLVYYGYRYYSPSAGRWTTRDPINEAGGVTLYGFALNAPEMFADSDGRLVITPLALYLAGGLLAAADVAASSSYYARYMQNIYNPKPGPPISFLIPAGRCTVTVFVGHNTDILRQLPAFPSTCSAVAGIGCGLNLQLINNILNDRNVPGINDFPELPYGVAPIPRPRGTGVLADRARSNKQAQNTAVDTEDTGVGYQRPVGFEEDLWQQMDGWQRYEESMRHAWLRAMLQARAMCRDRKNCCSSYAVILKFLPNRSLTKEEFKRAASLPNADFESNDELHYMVKCPTR